MNYYPVLLDLTDREVAVLGGGAVALEKVEGLLAAGARVSVYADDPTSSYVLFRYTVPVAMHAIASAIFALGITPRLLASARGEVPFLSGSWPFFAVAVGLHSAYNITAVALELFTDAFEF